MVAHIFKFELGQALRRPSTWMFALVYFGLALLAVHASAGAFSAVQVMSTSRQLLNSPVAVAQWVAIFSVFGTAAAGALVGGAGARDFETRMDPLILTSPVSKAAYLGGRFLGGTAAALLVLTAFPLGIAVAAAMPYLDRERFDVFRFATYWRPFLLLLLPNLLLTGTFFFAAAVLLRRGVANHVGAVLLIIGYFIAQQMMNNVDWQWLAALLDPFGDAPFALATRYWTIVERNGRVIPFGGSFGLNRLVWLGVAAVTWVFMLLRFRVTRDGEGTARHRAPADESDRPAPATVPVVQPHFTTLGWWGALWRLARRDLTELILSRSFALVMIAGLTLLLVVAPQATMIYGTPTYPVTYTILNVLGTTWSYFLLIAVMVYAGELVWRDRELRMDRITDALPIPLWTRYGAKLIALIGIVVVLLLLPLVGGVVTQAAQGYFRFELPVYIGQLFGIRLVDALLIGVLALTVHVLVNQKYLGRGVVALVIVGKQGLQLAGLTHNVFGYGSDGGWFYSDLDGYGHYIGPWIWWKLYWGAFAFVLAVVAILFWAQGHETTWRARWMAARRRFRPTTRSLVGGGVAGWFGLGGWILYNTNVLNRYQTVPTQERRAAAYERTYGRFRDVPQPRVVAVSVRADLYPRERAVTFRGRTTIKNMTARPIDTVLVHLAPRSDLIINQLDLDRPARTVRDDDEWRYRIFALARPLAPGDSADLLFDVAYRPRGFANVVENTGVVGNGTFVQNNRLPSIGYDNTPDAQHVRLSVGALQGVPRPVERRGDRGAVPHRSAFWRASTGPRASTIRFT